MPEENPIPSNPTTSEVSTTPPPASEVSQDKSGINPNVSLDNFEQEIGGVETEITKSEEKPEQKTPEPVKKEEPPKKEEPAKKDDKKARLPDIDVPTLRKKGPDGKYIDARDYTGLESEEVEMFKQMNNTAFNKLKPMFLEHKKLQAKVAELEKAPSQLPPSYYEHPDSFILHPEFGQKQKVVETAQAIEDYWREQLALVEEGKDWKMLEMDKDGNFKTSEPLPATGDAKARLISYLQHANNQKARVEGEFKSFVSGHQEKAKQVRAYVDTLEEKYFPYYNKEALAKPEMKPVVDMLEAAKNALPPELRSNIFVPFIAKSYALVMTLSQKINDLQEALEAKERVKENATLAGQPKDDGGGIGGGAKVLSLEDFEKELR